MRRTMVVVANRSGARVFEFKGINKGLLLRKELPNESLSRHPNSPRPIAAPFARSVASALEKARNQGQFEDLILVAEPGFLGQLRGSLSERVSKSIIGTVPRDLAEFSERDLARRLRDEVESRVAMAV